MQLANSCQWALKAPCCPPRIGALHHVQTATISHCRRIDRQWSSLVCCSSPVDEVNGSTTPSKLFSNLNPKTMQHEAGSLWGSALLVSGTTIGAGILALPAVTQEAGFVPAAATLTAVCAFSIATGLLVAEVTLRLMQQQGAGSVSMVSMADKTLGPGAAAATSAAYIFLHYALLVAYMSKAGEIISDMTGLPQAPAAACFAAVFASLCYFSSQKLLDKLNGGLVGLVVACFLGLLVAALPGVQTDTLMQSGNWSAVPMTLPVVALAFVYHNVVPVVVQALEGDAVKVRTAVCAGVAIPWLMFMTWEAAILGSLGSLEADQPVAQFTGRQEVQPVQQVNSQQQQQQQQGSSSLPTSMQHDSSVLYGAEGVISGEHAVQDNTLLGRSPNIDDTAATDITASSTTTMSSDPVAALAAGNATVGPLIQGFSFLAIATSFIGFVLGLTDFLVDALKLPDRQAPTPYLLTLVPPYAVAITNPNIFLQALDTAGTYGVLTLFGILPAAMAWKSRYSAAQHCSLPGDLLPGGRAALLAVAGVATAVIAYEFAESTFRVM